MGTLLASSLIGGSTGWNWMECAVVVNDCAASTAGDGVSRLEVHERKRDANKQKVIILTIIQLLIVG